MTAAARIHAVPAPPPDELLAEEGLFAGRVLLDERSAVLRRPDRRGVPGRGQVGPGDLGADDAG